MTQDVRLYQIAYDAASLAAVQASGFQVLDNLDNARPDWYECWPIRKFLHSTPLEEDAFYGFFSPKFGAKTQLSCTDVRDFVVAANARRRIDVALFSPQPDMGANFLNVFEQAELFDPGFIDTAQQFLRLQDIHLELQHVVMDSRQIVFSNYFVARPAFWRRWLTLVDALFAIAEDSSHPLSAALTYNTTYAANAHRKVFLFERLASLLLTVHPEYQVATANSFQFGWSTAKFRHTPTDTYINDALKMAYRETGFAQYMQAFGVMRSKLTQ